MPKFSFLCGIIFIGIFTSVKEIYGENILLFFPGGTYSHALGIWPYANSLAEKGHNITFFTAYKSPTGHSNINVVRPKILEELFRPAYGVDRFEDRRLGNEHLLWNMYHDVIVNMCEAILDPKNRKDPLLNNLLESQFDLVVVNSIFGDCGFIFAHHYKARYIIYHSAVLAVWQPDAFGYSTESSWIPDISKKFSYPLNIWERAINVILPITWMYERYTNFFPKMEKIMQNFLHLNDTPNFEGMERGASLVLTNTHYTTDFARSFPAQIIPVGGMALWQPEKPIPEDFDRFLNSSGKDGAVFISFGSSIELSTVPKYYQQIFLNLIKKFDTINFILKWKGELPEEYLPAPKNLLYSAWLPQKEILRHRAIRGFITHGGLNSIQEATYYGIPLIVLPLFADQDGNAYRIEAQEIGIPIELREITPEILENALQAILREPKYRENMIVRSKLFRDRPQNPISTAVYWTEFVLRHNDTSSMKPMNANLTWYQRKLLDVYALILMIAFAILFTFYSVIKFATSFCIQSNGKQKLKIK